MQITIYTIAYNRKMNNQRQNIRGIGSEPRNDKNLACESTTILPGKPLEKVKQVGMVCRKYCTFAITRSVNKFLPVKAVDLESLMKLSLLHGTMPR